MISLRSSLARLIERARPSHPTAGASVVPPQRMLGWYLRKALLPGIRGIGRRLTLGRSGFPIFVGGGVSIAYPRHMHMGAFSVLGGRSTVMALSAKGVWLGQRVTIRENAWIQCSSHPSNPGRGLWVGDDTYIGPSATLGIGGAVRIGARCQIGANVVIVAENHKTVDGVPSPTEVIRKGVTIGDDCWLGHRVTILDGVTLGPGCVVGAGAVVTRSFPERSRIAGVPAKAISVE